MPGVYGIECADLKNPPRLSTNRLSTNLAPKMGAQYTGDVRIIARGTLNGFVRNRVERRPQRIVQDHFDSWYALVSRAAWKNPAELNKQFRSASIISAERVVFNIKGNEFRLATVRASRQVAAKLNRQ